MSETKISRVLKLLIYGVICVSCLGLAGCGRKGGEAKNQAKPDRLVIATSGSDTMVNLAQMWAEEYQKVASNVTVEVAGGGSGVGEERVAAENPGGDHVAWLVDGVDRVEQTLHTRSNSGPGYLEQLRYRPSVRKHLLAVVVRMRQDSRFDEHLQGIIDHGDLIFHGLKLHKRIPVIHSQRVIVTRPKLANHQVLHQPNAYGSLYQRLIGTQTRAYRFW